MFLRPSTRAPGWLVSGWALLLLLLSSPCFAQTSVRFAVFGDYYGATPNTARVAALVSGWAPDFIVTSGDNCSEGSTAGFDASVGAYYHALIRYPVSSSSIYAAQGSPTQRFFPALGNHDVDAGIAAFAQYFELPGNERYYDFVQGPVHFFVLDSDPREADGITSTSVQAQWLQAGLAASSARWKVIILHTPPYTSSSTHSNAAELQWPFQAWGASAVMSGHCHNYERIFKNGLPYLVVGTGGQGLYGFNAAPEPGSVVRYNADQGALWVEATSDSLIFRFYAAGGGGAGTLVDAFSLPAAGTGGATYEESFDGFTTGQTVGTGSGWYDAGNGPVVESANGVAGSQGLAPASNIFTWTAHPFGWGDAGFERAAFQMDFQASGGGTVPLFDDDRIGWMTTASNVNSDDFFGVQLDPVTDPNTGLRIETYWRNANESRVAVPIADLTGIEVGAWYRLRLEVTKLGATSASLSATLRPLDPSGTPGAVVASGSIANTGAILPDTLRPNPRYFSSGSAFPAYKNYADVAGAADNAHAELVSGGAGPDDALGWWAFDDGSGSTAADGSGHGNTATVAGATWATGHFGGALAFDGVDDHVVVPHSASLDQVTDRMTLAFWLRGDVLTQDWVTAMQRTSASGAWFDWQLYARALDAPSTNHPVFRVDWDRDAVIEAGEQVEGDIVLSPGTWYFIACTCDGSAMRFYIDGTERGSTAIAGGTIPNGGRSLWLGGNDAWGEYFDGALDDVRIYDRALGQGEIQALMSGAVRYHVNVATVGSGTVTRSPDQALYDLDQVVRLTAIAAPGWSFTGWSGDLAGATNPQDLTVTRDMAVTAAFSMLEGVVPDTLVAAGAVWKYLDDGSDQGTAWRGLAFDDAAWASGPAQLGYGDGDEQTVVGYGPDEGNKYTTTYFRRAFDLPEAGIHNSLRLDLVRDDGAVVYLNGVEVFRSHMPVGAITSATLASVPAVGGAEESAFFSALVDPALLHSGTNVVAVEIHQVNGTSTDISFDLRLTGSITLGTTHVESFDAFVVPALLHDQPGWRDDGDGPSIEPGNGLAGSHGLTNATDIFTWQGAPFSWNDPAFLQAIFELDFQSSAGGTAALFDDDRIGWMTSRVSALSDSFFGVQLDPNAAGSAPNVETYWRNASGARVDSTLLDLAGLLTANTWYRLRLEVLKLGPASARLAVGLTRLDASGTPAAVVATGVLENTDALGAGAPAPRFFTVPTLYPAYKNYDAVVGAVDNAFARIVRTEAPPIQLASLVATPLGSGSVQVDWSTTTETRNAGFEVQRSADSLGGYETLPGSFVAGHGTTRVGHAYSHTDAGAPAGNSYYRLRQIATGGAESFTASTRATVSVGVDDHSLPLVFALESSLPNPCRGSSLIRYALPRACHVTLEVYGVTGQRVATLADGSQRAGRYVVRWEPRELPSGVYWYRLIGGGQTATRKVLLLR